MEPVTHALAAVALGRAGLDRVSPKALPMLLVSSVAADADWSAYLFGARAFLEGHRTATHSLAGTVAIAAATAVGFWWFGRKNPKAPLRAIPALAVCAAGALLHLLLDLTNSYGVKLLWPFSGKWFAGDMTPELDPWILLLLVVGLLLPGLFRLVSEEIGARPKQRGAQRWAVAGLLLVALYLGARWTLHDRAVSLLMARVYHGAVPLSAAAFPQPASPTTWTGLAETENTVEEVTVPFGPGGEFDPDRSRTRFKPEATPQLEAALKNKAAQRFLGFARYPIASVERIEEGFRIELRDARFSVAPMGAGEFCAVIEVNSQMQVVSERVEWKR